MAWTNLPTNYTDATWSGLRRYLMVNNEDGTVSFQDVTVYDNKENSFFGAKDANRMNEALNTIVPKINAIVTTGAGAHNAIYRGKSLGTAVTEAQWAAIKAGTFEDLYIGDYWEIGELTYRIAAFNYYRNTGDTVCTENHVTIVPDESMYLAAMNDTATTAGAYAGSKLYTTGMTQAKNKINNDFGEAHILKHRQYLKNAATNGYETGVSWYDSTVELMTEQNCYGCRIFGNNMNGTNFAYCHTVDKSQYPLFALCPEKISNGTWYWLRDVASSAFFALVSGQGNAFYTNANVPCSIRPAFSIYQS